MADFNTKKKYNPFANDEILMLHLKSKSLASAKMINFMENVHVFKHIDLKKVETLLGGQENRAL